MNKGKRFMQMEIDRVSNYSKIPNCSEGVDTADK